MVNALTIYIILIAFLSSCKIWMVQCLNPCAKSILLKSDINLPFWPILEMSRPIDNIFFEIDAYNNTQLPIKHQLTVCSLYYCFQSS